MQGDNPWVIAKRLHDAGSNASVNELMQGIQALNPGSERLSIGQRLLLPDSAILPTPAQKPAASAPSATDSNTEQLAASVLQTQQLQQTIEQLQARIQAQDQEIAGQRQQIGELQAQLTQASPPAITSELAPDPAEPTEPAPAVEAAPVAETEGIDWLWVGGLGGLLGLLALLLFLRHRQQQETADPVPLAARPDLALDDTDSYAERVDVEPPEVAASFNNGDTPLGDVLEGVGIYLTYGRFTEAAGLLRAALLAEPERTDLGLKLLDVLGKQGDVIGFQAQENHLLSQGVDHQTLEETRKRYPKIAMVNAPMETPAQPPAPMPAPEPVAAPSDEFELNLDGLSLENSWDLADDPSAAPAPGTTPSTRADTLALSGFDEPDLQWGAPLETESLDDDFLDGFADEEQALQLEPLSAEPEFESLSLEPVSFELQASEHSEKLEEAQNCIDEGDLKSAITLLEELLQEGDEPLKETARVLLAGIR